MQFMMYTKGRRKRPGKNGLMPAILGIIILVSFLIPLALAVSTVSANTGIGDEHGYPVNSVNNKIFYDTSSDNPNPNEFNKAGIIYLPNSRIAGGISPEISADYPEFYNYIPDPHLNISTLSGYTYLINSFIDYYGYTQSFNLSAYISVWYRNATIIDPGASIALLIMDFNNSILDIELNENILAQLAVSEPGFKGSTVWDLFVYKLDDIYINPGDITVNLNASLYNYNLKEFPFEGICSLNDSDGKSIVIGYNGGLFTVFIGLEKGSTVWEQYMEGELLVRIINEFYLLNPAILVLQNIYDTLIRYAEKGADRLKSVPEDYTGKKAADSFAGDSFGGDIFSINPSARASNRTATGSGHYREPHASQSGYTDTSEIIPFSLNYMAVTNSIKNGDYSSGNDHEQTDQQNASSDNTEQQPLLESIIYAVYISLGFGIFLTILSLSVLYRRRTSSRGAFASEVKSGSVSLHDNIRSRDIRSDRTGVPGLSPSDEYLGGIEGPLPEDFYLKAADSGDYRIIPISVIKRLNNMGLDAATLEQIKSDLAGLDEQQMHDLLDKFDELMDYDDEGEFL